MPPLRIDCSSQESGSIFPEVTLKVKLFSKRQMCLCEKHTDFQTFCPRLGFFHKNHKKTIEITALFVYNVLIAVLCTAVHERRMNIYVHCKCYSQRLLAGTQRQR